MQAKPSFIYETHLIPTNYKSDGILQMKNLSFRETN